MKKIPSYVWTFTALISGIIIGGVIPDFVGFIASGTTAAIQFIIKLVPLLIFAALAPAFSALVKRGLAGKFAFSVMIWFVISSAAAGLLGVVVSALVFRLPFSGNESGALSEATKMFTLLGQGGASYPLIAIVVAIFIGIISIWISPLFSFLRGIENAIGKMGKALGYTLIPILFCLGITIGVNFGPKLGMGHLLTISLYTMVLTGVWALFYVFVIIKSYTKREIKPLIVEYFLPTAIFGAGTISSLVTLPINLTNAKNYGVRKGVADFVIPFGAVANMDASALINLSFIPFVLTYIFGIEISWTVLFVAWPAIVLFTIAAPGLPAGMGTSLWTATLISSMVGLEDPIRSTFITTMVALYGGIPDMFVTAVNCTGDGFSAVLFDEHFDKYLDKSKKA